MSLPPREPQSTAHTPLPTGPSPRRRRRVARRVLSWVAVVVAVACFGLAAAAANGDFGGHDAAGQDIGSAVRIDGVQHAVDNLLAHAGAGVPAP